MKISVTYKQLCHDVAPKKLYDSIIGTIEDGIFMPSGSVAEYFFLLQRKQNDKSNLNKTNIYFIQAVNGGLVKIGSAKDVHKRLQTLQTGSPIPLMIVKIYENVDLTFEYELHNQFKQYRKHGEWFDESVLKLLKEI